MGSETQSSTRSRWLLLKNPWNLTDDQKERLSTLVRWNTPIVRAYYLKEAFQYLMNQSLSVKAAIRRKGQIDGLRNVLDVMGFQGWKKLALNGPKRGRRVYSQ